MDRYIMTKKYIQIRTKVPIDSDGTVFKEFNANEKFRRQDVSIMLKLLPLIAKYKLDFLPRIVQYNDKGYRYKFVEGKTLKEEIDQGMRINQKMIYEMNIAMNDIWKRFYDISIENKDNELFRGNGFLYHGDPWLGNVIWNNDTRELKFIDLDSLSIAEFIPLTQLNNMFFQHLETLLMTQDNNKSTLGTWI
jgi:hypothetical protein